MRKEEERKSNKAIRYRLYPNAKQREMFARTFGCCRKVWNLMLSDKKASYDKTGSFGSQTPAMYKKEYPYLKEVDSLALANVQLNLQQAMRNCFDKTRKKRSGFTQFKSAKSSRKSYTTNNQNGTVAILDKAIRLPKESTKIANSLDIVCVEDLNMKAMSNKGFGNGKATLDNGYGMFLNMLEYKLADRGKRLVKVDKWFPSSQICSCCGAVHPEIKNLSARTMICGCGAVLNRDYNAAINIKKEGLRLLETVA